MNVPRVIRRIFRAPYDGLRHFGVVEQGVLYRCGQPTPEQLDELIVRHSLRTVICVRGVRREDDPDTWKEWERDVCAARDVELIHIPCNHKNPPSATQVEEFLDLTRDANRRPILVHCRLGRQRALVFCALYRVHVQGVEMRNALREMDEHGFGLRRRRHQRLLDVVYSFRDVPQLVGQT